MYKVFPYYNFQDIFYYMYRYMQLYVKITLGEQYTVHRNI